MAAGRPPRDHRGGVAVRPRPSRPPGPGSTASVSLSSAERFAAKVRSRRRRRILIVLALVAVLGFVVWVVLGSSWATVQHVEVIGVHRTDPAIARAAGDREQGQPLLLARVAEVRREVARQPLVRRVTVSRHWPSTLRIQIVERQPVAAIPVQSPAKDGFLLVDGDGVTIATAAGRRQVPSGMPVFDVDVTATRGVPALRACLAVSSVLPAAVKNQVTAIGATSPDGIWLQLRSGAKVQWGDAGQSPFKATVLLALLRQHAKAYDLRAPENPAVRT